MNIANALKQFFFKLNGTTPSGDNIADVIKNGADSVGDNIVHYTDSTKQSLDLTSSETATKTFRVSVDDSGTLTAVEVE